jgi:hypothetical protein
LYRILDPFRRDVPIQDVSILGVQTRDVLFRLHWIAFLQVPLTDRVRRDRLAGHRCPLVLLVVPNHVRWGARIQIVPIQSVLFQDVQIHLLPVFLVCPVSVCFGRVSFWRRIRTLSCPTTSKAAPQNCFEWSPPVLPSKDDHAIFPIMDRWSSPADEFPVLQ